MELDAEPLIRTFEPARPVDVAGSPAELSRLWDALVDHCGSSVIVHPDSGGAASRLAQHFISEAGKHFRDVLWVECADRSESFILGEIAAGLGVTVEASDPQPAATLAAALEQQRVLLVLDDVRDAPPFVVPADGFASLLMTTRDAHLTLPAHVARVELAGPPQAVPPRSPTGAGSASMLLRAMSVCRENRVPLALAGDIAGLSGAETVAGAAELVESGQIEALDNPATCYRLVHGARPEAQPEEMGTLRRLHADALCRAFRAHEAQGQACRPLVAELESAMTWALANDWEMAVRLVRLACQFPRRRAPRSGGGAPLRPVAAGRGGAGRRRRSLRLRLEPGLAVTRIGGSR